MEDIHYTNLMLELEKLSDRLNRVEEKFDALKSDLVNRVVVTEAYIDTRLKEKYHPFITEKDDKPKISVEDFSRFWNEGNIDKLKEEKGFE